MLGDLTVDNEYLLFLLAPFLLPTLAARAGALLGSISFGGGGGGSTPDPRTSESGRL